MIFLEKMPNGLTVMTQEQIEEFFVEFKSGVLFGQIYIDGLPEDFTEIKTREYKEYRSIDEIKKSAGNSEYVFMGVPIFNPGYHLSEFVFNMVNADLEECVYIAKDFASCDWMREYVNMSIDLNTATKGHYKQQLTDILRERILKSMGIFTMT